MRRLHSGTLKPRTRFVFANAIAFQEIGSIMDEINSQRWVACFESAIMELDPERLDARIGIAEAAIDMRLFDLKNDSDHHQERGLITDAQRTLRSLRHVK
jgi:hypothetical protein